MKVLKNTTSIDIELDMGITIQANSSREVIVQDYINLSNDTSLEQLDVLITIGSIVINDGTNDLSIEEGKAFVRYPDEAKNIRYDNTILDVEATNVQDAITLATSMFDEDKILSGYNMEVLIDEDGNVLTEE